MIVITVEMWPGGKKQGRYLLGTAIVSNIGGGTKARGDYQYGLALKTARVWRDGEIKNFPRSKRNVWYLLKEILKCLDG